MTDQSAPESFLREISELETRIGELRQAAAVPATDLKATLDAALLELDLALSSLRLLGGSKAPFESGGPAEEERRILRTLFQAAPVPLFLLDRDGDIRRINSQAAELLGTSPGYVSGRPFHVFCDLKTRAALRSHIAAVVRTGERTEVEVRLLSGRHPIDVSITLVSARVGNETSPLVVAAALPIGGQLQAPMRTEESDAAVAAVLHRMDVLAMTTELLLDEPLFNEPVAIRRCARLLASELADWAFVDIQQDGALHRQVVFGPSSERQTAHTIEGLRPGSLPQEVHTTLQPVLHAHLEDLDLLGTTPGGISVAGLLGITSVLSVPIEDGHDCIGVITLASGADSGHFDLTDLGVVQRVARHLALVIRAARMYRRSAEVSTALQASLLPRNLPEIPGAIVAAQYAAATRGVEVGGDFYDVFRTPEGWGLVLGDVCGKGEDAAAVTAAARHGIRQLARWKTAPAEVLSMVNETLLTEERYVTGVFAVLSAKNELSVASAGHPPVIVIKADGSVRVGDGGGVPLGLFEDFSPGVETMTLEEGDTLLLHSDGVLDACDEMRQRFGEERLMEVLAGQCTAPLPELLGAVERALLHFCGDDMGDDVSMLALRVVARTLD